MNKKKLAASQKQPASKKPIRAFMLDVSEENPLAPSKFYPIDYAILEAEVRELIAPNILPDNLPMEQLLALKNTYKK